jgi:hypothetical protein
MKTPNPSVRRAAPGLINGLITLITAWPIAHQLGLTSVIDLLMYWAGYGRYVVLALWYALVFSSLAALLRGTALLCGQCWFQGNIFVEKLGQWFAALVRAAKAASAKTLKLLSTFTLRLAWDKLWKPIEDRLLEFMSALEIERQLRAEYRKNFRHQYRTFKDFKRAYYGEEEEEQKRSTTSAQSPLSEAFALLGLPETCTRAELEAQHRKLMKKLHPDVGGTQVLAAKVNHAKDLIIKQKGWR